LHESVRGEFDISIVDLEAWAEEKEKKRLIIKSEANSSCHYKKMAEDYTNYIEAAHDRIRRSRVNNPEHHTETRAKRAAKYLAEKTYHCEACDISFTTQHSPWTT
jgi:hypothetical protein